MEKSCETQVSSLRWLRFNVSFCSVLGGCYAHQDGGPEAVQNARIADRTARHRERTAGYLGTSDSSGSGYSLQLAPDRSAGLLFGSVFGSMVGSLRKASEHHAEHELLRG
ncbi:hypothetical protein ON010_g17208 [Phytophthora cinnamomi]|nr:hypothetical protein ON010_g17208 [Phytophthora cinnamomi]